MSIDEKERDGIPVAFAADAAAWRAWLATHHQSLKRVWLVLFSKNSGVASITHDLAVDEALCFGWIDSKAQKRDALSRYQFFSKRNPKSKWSAVNKAKVARLIEEGKMAESGMEMVRIAQANGSWAALDAVEALEIPDDLQAAFERHPHSAQHFHAFPKSARKMILEWIRSAKRSETRAQRIEETARLAANNVRARR